MSSLNPIAWLRGALTETKQAHVAEVEQLPPGTDGRQYRYEIAVLLDESVEDCPTEDEVREIAETVVDEVTSIDNPEWEGADELFIQVYSPDRGVGKGACGTAHWVDGSYKSLDRREYLF